MPEGPEIKQCADRLSKAISGRPIRKIFFAFDHLKPFEEVLQKSLVERIIPRGKALLIYFKNGLVIYSHNQLYGRWYVKMAQRYPATNRSLRLAIHTDKKSALLYSASDIEVIELSGIASHPFLKKLGPDVLADETTHEHLVERLNNKMFSGRQLGTLLLDQHFLAGLGNYLRCEILFVTGLNPRIKPNQLPHEKVEELAHTILSITRQSYQTKGITNDLIRVQSLKKKGLTRRHYRHHVFARAGKLCYICQQTIRKSAHAGRPFFYCNVCQPGCF